MAIVQPDRIGAWFRTSEKKAASLHLVPIFTRRSGTYVEQLDYLAGARAVSEGHQGDGRIRTLGDAWEHAIGNAIAGPAYCPTD